MFPFFIYTVQRIVNPMNLKAILLVSLIASPIPAFAQQTNIYSVCTNYQENYNPGYYDQYGNYVRGNVNTQQYNVQCGTGTYYRPNAGPTVSVPVVAQPGYGGYGRRSCSPARTTLGGLLGGGIAAVASKRNSWSWAIPLGAVLGTGAANATCY